MSKTPELDGTITEKRFRQHVIDAARQFGWLVYWTWNSKHSPAGFPDLVLLRGDELIFAELKSQKGKTTTSQDEWLEGLSETHNEVYVWRPSDWDTILDILRKK